MLGKFLNNARPQRFFIMALAILAAIPTLGRGFAPAFHSLVGRFRKEIPLLQIELMKLKLIWNPILLTL